MGLTRPGSQALRQSASTGSRGARAATSAWASSAALTSANPWKGHLAVVPVL